LESQTKDYISEIRQSAKVEEYRGVIQQIASGMNIWDLENPNTAVHRERVLPLQAQSSTNHNMERNVKIAGWMTFTGKDELKASAYSMASNDFIIENKAQIQIDEDDDDEEGTDEADCQGNKTITKRKRGERYGPKRALHLANTVLKKAREYGDIARAMGPDEFKTLSDNIHDCLTSKTESLMERRKEEMVSVLMGHANDTKALNATERVVGVDIPPVLLGLIPIGKLTKATHGKEQLLELGARGIEWGTLTWTARWLALEKDEIARWKNRNPGKKDVEFHKGYFRIVSEEVAFDYMDDQL
jgi:hypothetical protein